jgi:hypothetical protein
MKKPGLCLLMFFVAISVRAQQPVDVCGEVKDSAGLPLQGVSVKLLAGKDSLLAISDEEGNYLFSVVKASSFTLKVTYTGLQAFTQTYMVNSARSLFRVPTIQLLPAGGELETIVIKSVRPVLIKEDTVQYDVSAYKVREGAPVEDVVKKLPGVTIDKDGNIEAQGKKVARVRVNGKDFFGGDVQTATQNLPADVIQNIQIIDDYGEGANLTGVKNGEPEKIININTQANKSKGNFGNATAAIGNEGRYAANLFGNNFNGERQASVLAAVNNTNANLFNFNGGGRGGGARGANSGSDSRSVGGAGITLSNSAGVNFRDKWGQKISVYGSYSFSTRNGTVMNSSFSQDINPLNIRNTQRESTSKNNSTNHRATLNLEYALDSFNYIKASPYISYSKSNSETVSRSEMSRAKYFTLNNNLSSGTNSAPNAGANFFYNHKFGKRGRNFSANVNLDYSNSRNNRFSDGVYHNIDSSGSQTILNDTLQIQSVETASRNTRTNFRLSYMEPLNETGTTFLEVNYDWNRSSTQSLRDVNDFLDLLDKTGRYNERQSNHYNYQFTTNKAGISIRGRKEKYNYSIGFHSQPARLSGGSVGKNYATSYSNVNWVPSLRMVYNFGRNHSLTATVDGNSREPGFFQLQPVADSSNLNNIVVGNPNLVNEFVNTYALRYNKFDGKTGNSLFVNLSYDRTDDKIVSSRMNNPSGTGRTTTYQNTNGFYGYNANTSFNKPLNNRKYIVGLSFSGSLDNNISFTDGQKNRGSNWNLRPGASFRVDLENKVDVTLRADYTAYQTTTRYASIATITTKAQTLNYGVNGKNYFGDLTVGYDFSRLFNYGFSSSVNSNPSVLNLFAEYRLLKAKKMTLRLQAFDLFDKNTGIVRSVNETTIMDSRTNRLGRYFLLSVNVRLSKFTGSLGGRKGNGRRDVIQ